MALIFSFSFDFFGGSLQTWGKLTLSQSDTLSTITSSLGYILLLLDTWALVDATAKGYNDSSCMFLEMLINRGCLGVVSLTLNQQRMTTHYCLRRKFSSYFNCLAVCAITIRDDAVILAFSFTFYMFEGSPWKGWKTHLITT
ncbi:hypothetical protein SLEP1_g25720 [Rubroshorea leprosula]|uniref:Uncharacterized protein n=1 Tax=Rubroshorea leprosula TaxID=152421 RepID=A0AAV5JK16_9ROSI|nr:hypothetical protein SLEP1_g25720 [Rubroshorea leprosula]